MWKDAALTSWAHGTGGWGNDSGKGGGGGGFGGGGGGTKSSHHYGGGGGGYARKATVAKVNDDLILGSAYNPGYGAIYLTFSLD